MTCAPRNDTHGQAADLGSVFPRLIQAGFVLRSLHFVVVNVVNLNFGFRCLENSVYHRDEGQLFGSLCTGFFVVCVTRAVERTAFCQCGHEAKR
jgi:hypothetical protein